MRKTLKTIRKGIEMDNKQRKSSIQITGEFENENKIVEKNI